jgi:hypothetical protein
MRGNGLADSSGESYGGRGRISGSGPGHRGQGKGRGRGKQRGKEEEDTPEVAGSESARSGMEQSAPIPAEFDVQEPHVGAVEEEEKMPAKKPASVQLCLWQDSSLVNTGSEATPAAAARRST